MRVRFDICPVRFVGLDVIELVERFKTAGERLSFTEQEELPAPYLEGCLFAGQNLEMVRAQPPKRS